MSWKANKLKELQEKRTTYSEMMDYCCDNMVLANYAYEELSKNFYFETYCGSLCSYYDEDDNEITYEEYCKLEEEGKECREEYDDIYQYFIISNQDAERLSDWTNELVLYNEDLDLNFLCVKHFGTPWSSVPANWKDEEDLEDD